MMTKKNNYTANLLDQGDFQLFQISDILNVIAYSVMALGMLASGIRNIILLTLSNILKLLVDWLTVNIEQFF